MIQSSLPDETITATVTLVDDESVTLTSIDVSTVSGATLAITTESNSVTFTMPEEDVVVTPIIEIASAEEEVYEDGHIYIDDQTATSLGKVGTSQSIIFGNTSAILPSGSEVAEGATIYVVGGGFDYPSHVVVENVTTDEIIIESDLIYGETGGSYGYGYVTFTMPAEAVLITFTDL